MHMFFCLTRFSLGDLLSASYRPVWYNILGKAAKLSCFTLRTITPNHISLSYHYQLYLFASCILLLSSTLDMKTRCWSLVQDTQSMHNTRRKARRQNFVVRHSSLVLGWAALAIRNSWQSYLTQAQHRTFT